MISDSQVETAMAPEIKWNPNVKLIIADVDETIADVYTAATPEMVQQLNKLKPALFMATGTSLARVQTRIVDQLDPIVRSKILISHCNGSEVWGHNPDGSRKDKPYYSLYDEKMTESQKKAWREIVQELIKEFKLKTFPASTIAEFKKIAGDDPLSVMLDDRGPQITFEVVNGYDLTPEQEKQLEVDVSRTNGAMDLRIPILERADELLRKANVPVTPRLGGIFALDLGLKGVSKANSIKHVLESDEILTSLGLSKKMLNSPDTMEIWGDKFDKIGGSDRHMCEAVDPSVRAIDFRSEDPAQFPEGFNIVLWDGKQHLHNGLLEYLQLSQG